MSPATKQRKLRRRFSSISPAATWSPGVSKRRNSPPATSLGFAIQDLPNGIVEDSIHSAPSHRHMFIKSEEEEEKPIIPLVYSSLPPTPISTSPPLPFDQKVPPPLELEIQPERKPDLAPAPFSLWDYLQEELLATDFDSHQELKWERVSNFLSIPLAMEKIIGFGFIVCLDSFLYTFTIQPIRFVFAFTRFLANFLLSIIPFHGLKPPPLPPSQKADILRTLLLVLTVVILVPLTDASKIYHTIRGQDTIKLYVIFNALEIADRLCASIGQDILDCLFSRSTLEPLSHRIPLTTHTFRPILYFLLATLYTVTHALVMVYQLISLNVAINSYDHALLTLLVSNQFVEIKGSVFKKFEKDNLFQITCADIVERFTLALMLTVVAFRNLIELSGSEFVGSEGFVLPKSFGSFKFAWTNNVFWTISYPVLTVMASEMLVDWFKHAFITKFNHIRPSVYERYTDVLCRDLASGSAVGRRGARKHTYVDQSPLVARRLGFASLPLAVLAIIIGWQTLGLMFSMRSDYDWMRLSHPTWVAIGVLFWIWYVPSQLLDFLCLCSIPPTPRSFLVIKVIIGVNLLSFASHRQLSMSARELADAVNDFGRDPIGEGKDERAYNKKLKSLVDREEDDVPRTAEIGEGNGGGGKGGKKERVKLEDLTRYTMVKRIW
ncbi:hypothetical protein H0H92_006681 [Tricholoma furcatifolium]|nr:hypothetical protein H0H92_006681 [Tricholoma furcatifolium]